MNGRQARRQRAAERARQEHALEQARKAAPVLVAILPSRDEVWSVGPIMAVIPPLLDEFPDEVKHAVDRRRRATLHGQCDCGAIRRLIRPGHATLDHHDRCPASDANLSTIGAPHGLQFVRWRE